MILREKLSRQRAPLNRIRRSALPQDKAKHKPARARAL